MPHPGVHSLGTAKLRHEISFTYLRSSITTAHFIDVGYSRLSDPNADRRGECEVPEPLYPLLQHPPLEQVVARPPRGGNVELEGDRLAGRHVRWDLQSDWPPQAIVPRALRTQ